MIVTPKTARERALQDSKPCPNCGGSIVVLFDVPTGHEDNIRRAFIAGGRFIIVSTEDHEQDIQAGEYQTHAEALGLNDD